MAIARIGFYAHSIFKQANMTVILPEGRWPHGEVPGGPYPVWYLLHGILDDDSMWARYTSLERYVYGMPLIVVMPDGSRGGYTDARRGNRNYESHIMKDVIGFVDRMFPTIPERRGRAIGGLSMGARGAMKLALKYPDRFCSVVTHSVGYQVTRPADDAPPERKDSFALLYGDDETAAADDPHRLAEQIDRKLLPAIRFDCGTEDGLLEGSRAFHRHLDKLGIRHEYAEFPGGHDWDYWDPRIREALKFHAAALGI